MKNSAKIIALALLLFLTVTLSVQKLIFHEEAFTDTTKWIVLTSAALGLVAGVFGIWKWSTAMPKKELRLLPASRKGRLIVLLGLAITGIGSYGGFLVLIPIGFVVAVLPYGGVAVEDGQGAH